MSGLDVGFTVVQGCELLKFLGCSVFKVLGLLKLRLILRVLDLGLLWVMDSK